MRFRVRKLLRYIDEHPSEIAVHCTYDEKAKTNDEKIISSAWNYNNVVKYDDALKYKPMYFVTNDLAMKALAKQKLITTGCNIISEVVEQDKYTGYKDIVMDDKAMSDFYSNPTKNTYGLLINEYINVYNPYKEYVDKNTNISVKANIFGSLREVVSISAERLQLMGAITEEYLDSEAVDSSVNDIAKGLNQIIENTIAGKENCYILDVKGSFDTYFDRELEPGEKKYDVVQTNVMEVDSITVTGLNAETIKQDVEPYIDPHPTEKGHGLIAGLLIQWHESLQ
jgi:hypothetical protein